MKDRALILVAFLFGVVLSDAFVYAINLAIGVVVWAVTS